MTTARRHDGRGRAVLAIDTATTRVVVAVGDRHGRPLGESTWLAGYRHGEQLLPSIGRLLGEANVRRSRLEAVIVGKPGAEFFHQVLASVDVAPADALMVGDDVFVTTKLPQSNAGRERTTLEESLAELGLDYVDLWLIHWPPGGRARPDVWERLLELQAEGLARDVGVSNYSLAQLDELERATGRLATVNQVEWSPALFDREVLDGHRRRGVQLEGYSPLRLTNLRDRRLARIADAHGVTPAQVVLRWHVEHRIVAIPKSTNAERIAENAAIFDFRLTTAEIEELDGLADVR